MVHREKGCKAWKCEVYSDFHSMRRKGRIIVHKLLPVIKTVENLENGTSGCELSRSEIRILHKLYREHRNHFRQNGFEYT